MSDPLHFTYESTPNLWRCYYDVEGPQGFGKTKDEALFDLWLSCDGEEEPLMKAIVAALPANDARAVGMQELLQQCRMEPCKMYAGFSCSPEGPGVWCRCHLARAVEKALADGEQFQCCGASDPPCDTFDGSCKNPANYEPPATKPCPRCGVQTRLIRVDEHGQRIENPTRYMHPVPCKGADTESNVACPQCNGLGEGPPLTNDPEDSRTPPPCAACNGDGVEK